jgi:AcrR family transcriptional regulator
MNATLAAPADTKTRILDAAERVFSQDGFDAASLRTITAAAQVNLAAVNYHFHSKDALFSAVIERRIRPINLRRIEMLDSISGKLTPEKIIDAFVRPPLEIASAEQSIVRPLMARLYGVPRELHTRVLEDTFGPLLNRFFEALATALPAIPREELQWRLFFIVGAMSQAMAWGPLISKFIEGKSNASDAETLIARLVRFGAAGMKANTLLTKRVNH